jgi:hypothetical protein
MHRHFLFSSINRRQLLSVLSMSAVAAPLTYASTMRIVRPANQLQVAQSAKKIVVSF